MTNPGIRKTSENTWILTLEEDPDTGDLIMPLPEELLESQGWKTGDTLIWNIDNHSQSVTLSKKD